MTDSIDINMVFPSPTEQPSLNRLDHLGKETDQYRTSTSVVDTINLGGETDSGYRYSTGLDTYDADADWYTLPSMPAVKMVLLASDLEDSPDLEDTVQDVLDRIAFIYQSVDGCQYVYGLDVEHQTKLDRDSGPIIPVSQESLADNRIEAVSWLMVFSPELAEKYGREWLLSAPAWERREFDDGAIMLVASPDPTDWNEASTARRDLANYFDLSR